MEVKLKEVSLEAELHVSTSPTAPFLVLSHPHPVYGGTMHNKVVDQIFRRSVERDWSVLRYNTRGFGKSTGSFNEGVGEEKDLLELIEWAGTQKGIQLDQMLLVGYSFGSWLTAKVADKLSKPCVLIAPPVTMYPFPTLQNKEMKMVFSAEKDELIPFEKVKAFADSLPDPKLHIALPSADHYFIGTTAQLVKKFFEVLDQFKFQNL